MAGPTISFQTGVHGSRPAASSGCVWYWCTTHSKVYRSDGAAWADLQDLSGFAAAPSGAITASGYTQATGKLLGRSTASTGAIEEITVGSNLTLSAGTLSATGSSGLAQSFLGYNTVGGTWTTVTLQRYYNKKFTLSASSFVASLDVHLRPSTDSVGGAAAVITQDNSNAPGILVAGTSTSAAANAGAMYLSNSSSMPGTGRWVSFAIGAYLPAGDYWAGFAPAVGNWDIANDGSGSDQIFTMSGGNFLATGAYPTAWALSDSTRKYSIRVCILS